MVAIVTVAVVTFSLLGHDYLCVQIALRALIGGAGYCLNEVAARLAAKGLNHDLGGPLSAGLRALCDEIDYPDDMALGVLMTQRLKPAVTLTEDPLANAPTGPRSWNGGFFGALHHHLFCFASAGDRPDYPRSQTDTACFYRVHHRRTVSLAVGNLRAELGSVDGAFSVGSARTGSAADGFASTS